MAKPSRPLTPAEAWCWVARMLSREADEHYYSWPRTEDALKCGVACEEASAAAYARAKKLGATKATWKSALRKWDAVTEPKRSESDA
jgi:hypothetical protein